MRQDKRMTPSLLTVRRPAASGERSTPPYRMIAFVVALFTPVRALGLPHAYSDALSASDPFGLSSSSDIGPSGCPSTTLRACSGHGMCDAGLCSCDRGFSGGACDRREYLFACPRNCSASTGGGKCVDDRCVCSAGFSGDDCGDRTGVSCSPACVSLGHGECISGACVCRPGFYGADCLQGCEGYDASLGKPCSGRGICAPTGSPGHSADMCKCHVGFDGSGCELDLEGVTTCERNCSWPHGTCHKGRCTCAARHAGRDCSIELRHGELAHALDSPLARLGAVGLGLFVSSLCALLALRYVNVGAGKVLEARGTKAAAPERTAAPK